MLDWYEKGFELYGEVSNRTKTFWMVRNGFESSKKVWIVRKNLNRTKKVWIEPEKLYRTKKSFEKIHSQEQSSYESNF